MSYWKVTKAEILDDGRMLELSFIDDHYILQEPEWPQGRASSREKNK